MTPLQRRWTSFNSNEQRNGHFSTGTTFVSMTRSICAHPHQAIASAGIIPGVFTCMFSGGASAFGLYLLSRAATKTPHRRSSFFAVAELTYPKAAIFFDAAIAIKCFGVSIR